MKLRSTGLTLALPVLLSGCAGRPREAPPGMDYIDAHQMPVPPQALSPFEPKVPVQVDEPLLELDSDWNLDVKLFSKFRYTNEFVRRWRSILAKVSK